MRGTLRLFLRAALLAVVGLITVVGVAERGVAVAAEKTIYVGPQRVECEGMGPQLCYQIKEKPDQKWQLYFWDIVGFNHEEGYTYRLRVEEVALIHPVADGPDFEWKLLEIVEKSATAGGTQNSPARDMPRTGGGRGNNSNIVPALLTLFAASILAGVLIRARYFISGQTKQR